MDAMNKMTKYILSILLLSILFSSSFASEIIYDNLHKAKIVSTNNNTKLLVIFGADWCKFCNNLKTDLSNNIEVLDDHTICYIDSDSHKLLSIRYRVKTIPDYMILQDNKIIKRQKGYTTFDNFLEWLR